MTRKINPIPNEFKDYFLEFLRERVGEESCEVTIEGAFRRHWKKVAGLQLMASVEDVQRVATEIYQHSTEQYDPPPTYRIRLKRKNRPQFASLQIKAEWYGEEQVWVWLGPALSRPAS